MAMVKKEFIKEAGEFKKFIARGNVIDMSVAVLVGGAFGKIISSLVNDVVMPLLGMILGKVNIAQLSITLRQPVTGADGTVTDPGVILYYGKFLQNTIDFLIISLSVFLFLRIFFARRKSLEKNKKPDTPPPPPAPTETEKLLTEIRDLLKK